MPLTIPTLAYEEKQHEENTNADKPCRHME
jgi:hypothetical protein